MNGSIRPLLLLPALCLVVGSRNDRAAAAECAQCAPSPTGDKQCDAHRKSGSKALAKTKIALKYAKTPQERIEVLSRIAEIHAPHENAPLAEAAESLARSLDDKSNDVRQAAIVLLGKKQPPETAVPKLLGLVDDIDEAQEKAAKPLRQLEARLSQARLALAKSGKGKSARTTAEIEQLEAKISGVKQETEFRWQNLPLVYSSLASYPTSDVRNRLGDSFFSISLSNCDLLPELAPALLEIGGRQELRRLRGALSAYRIVVDLVRKLEGELGADAAKATDHMPGWKSKYGEQIYQQVLDFAKRRQLPDLPPWDEASFDRNFDTWFAEVGPALKQ